MPSVSLPRPFDAYKGKEPYLFISYAHVDAGLVYPELVALKNLGYRIWYDEGIDPGNEWPDEIAMAIQNSTALLVYISPNSVSSHNVRDEINFAGKLNLPIYAVHLVRTDMPPGLNLRLSSSESFLMYEQDAEGFLEKLISTLPPSLRGEPVQQEADKKTVIEEKSPARSKGLPKWTYLLGGVVLFLLIFGVTLFALLKPSDQVVVPTAAALHVLLPSATAERPSPAPSTTPAPSPTEMLPSPTPLPFTWARVNTGEFVNRDAIGTIAIDPQDATVMYAGTDAAGLYKTTDSGVSWVPIQGSLSPQVYSVAIDPQNHLTLYAVTLRGVYKSLDGGSSWQGKDQGLPNLPGSQSKMIIDLKNSSHLTLVYASAIYLSDDGGETWQVRYEGGCPAADRSLAVDPHTPDTWYMVHTMGDGTCQHGFYKSVDGGKTWNRKREFKSQGYYNNETIQFETAADGKTYIYTMNFLNNPNLGPLTVSSNGGDSWSDIQPEFSTIGTDPSGGILAKIFQGKLLRISAGAIRESLDLPGVQQNIILVSPSVPKTIMVAGDMHKENVEGRYFLPGLLISTDGGRSFQERANGIGMDCSEIQFNPYNSSAVYLQNGCGSGFINNGYFSLDVGVSWQQFLKMQATDTHNFWNFAFDPDGRTIYATSSGANNSFFSTVNNVDNWMARQNPPAGGNSGYMFFTDPFQSSLVYFMGGDPQNKPVMLVSKNGGTSWDTAHAVSLPLDNLSWFFSLYFDHDKGDHLYALKSGLVLPGQVIASTDHGKSWSRCGPIPATGRTQTMLAVDPRDSSHIFLATQGKGIQTSMDGCQTWSSSSAGLSNPYVSTLAMDPKNPDTLYAGTDGGAFMSNDGGKTWSEINQGLLGAPIIFSMAINPRDNTLYAASPYGIFKLEKK